MARVGSGDSFDIATWAEKENPGSGSQDFTVFTDTGLNGNWKRIWRAIKTILKADGTMNDSVIDYNHLKTTVADSSSIEVGGTPAQLRVKAGGITGAMLASTAADAASLEVASSHMQVKANGITGAMLKQSGAGAVVDEVTLEFVGDKMQIAPEGVGTTQLIDASVTPAKLAYKEWVGFLSQAGTADPTPTILSNTLGGTVTWTRIGTGAYRGTLTGLMTLGKTIVFVSGALTVGLFYGVASTSSADYVTVYTTNYTGTGIDAVMSNHAVMIRVYP